MPMEPNRTRQVIQDLARAFNKLASELTADLSYAAREIETLRREVQRLRASLSKGNRTNGSSRNHRHMEQRQAARLTRAAPPIKELLMAPRLAMNQRNLFTSRDHSFFHKSLSTQALHPSLALQETTERPHNQEAGFGQREASPVSV